MPIFSAGDVIRVPFPYVESEVREMRPALVIGSAFGPGRDLIWALMITSAANRGWPGDVALEDDHRECGLPIPSLIRTEKVAVLEANAAGFIGRISAAKLDAVKAKLRESLAL